MKIDELLVYSPNLPAQLSFYGEVLRWPVLEQKKSSFSVQAGYSVLKFIQKADATPYHIAFNIPYGQEREALQWLKERVVILKDGEDELIQFDAWNARAMYFYDADKNIIEFIARRDVAAEEQAKSGAHLILGVSEIGVPVDDVKQAYLAINSIKPISVYDGSFDRFCAAGDPHGLFIIIDKNKKNWFPTNDPAFSSDFKIKGEISGHFRDGIFQATES